MSRLWSSLSTKLWPSPPGAIGLGFSGNSVVAVRAVYEGAGYRITHMSGERLPFTPFANSSPREEDSAILSQAIQRLAASVPQAYWPLQIALPDPAAIFQVMEFDSLPDTPLERAAIAQFRLEKEFPTLPKMQCTTQVISEEGEPGLLLATFIQRAWLDCLNSACRAAKFVPSVIDISLSHLFNRFYDVVKAGSGDGVLISVEPDSWSIMIWDDAHRPRFVRSRWRDTSSVKNEECGVIVQDVERLIVSYVLRVPGRRIGVIYLCANDNDREPLVSWFDKRMQIPCVQLDASDSFFVTPGLSMPSIPQGVLSATITRT